MGGDDSQKLLPWRGSFSSPGRSRPPVHRIKHCNGSQQRPSCGTEFSTMAQLHRAWVIFGKHRWVISRKRRRTIRVKVDAKRPSKTEARFERCLDTLQDDKVITEWKYERQDGPWSEWTVTIEPPEVVQQQYKKIEPNHRLGPLSSLGEQIRARRHSLGLSQLRLAEDLQMSQAILCQVETGKAKAPKRLQDWLAS